MISLNQLFESSVKEKATDIYIKAGEPPAFLINYKVVKAKSEVLTDSHCQDICYNELANEDIDKLKKDGFLVKVLVSDSGSKFRAQITLVNGSVSGVFRRLLKELPGLKEINFPSSFKAIVNHNSGIVLFCGPKNSGKTSSLAAIVDYYNLSLIHI